MSHDPETRCLDTSASEVRMETTDAGKPVLRGVALRYGSLSNPLKDSKGRSFREQFAPGAFSRALATGADVRMLVNHDRNLIMGRTASGTLRLSDDGDALRFECDPPDTVLADHYRKAVERGDMSGVSFRFYKLRDSWDGAGEATVRTVSEADIDDVSVVTYPAYPDTEAAARSLDEHFRGAPERGPSPCRRLAFLMAARLRLADADANAEL